MNPRMQLVALCAAAVLAACSDATRTTAPASSPDGALKTQTHGGEKYVAIGTSISMGWASNGVYAGSQRSSFPAQLRFGSVPQLPSPLA